METGSSCSEGLPAVLSMGTIYPSPEKSPSARIKSTHTDSSNMLNERLSFEQLLM
jgi:hypothetical protein